MQVSVGQHVVASRRLNSHSKSSSSSSSSPNTTSQGCPFALVAVHPMVQKSGGAIHQEKLQQNTSRPSGSSNINVAAMGTALSLSTAGRAGADGFAASAQFFPSVQPMEPEELVSAMKARRRSGELALCVCSEGF